MLIYWTINILLGVIFIDSYNWSITGFLFIYTLCIAFTIGYLLPKTNKQDNFNNLPNIKILKIALLISIILGLCNFLTQLWFYGFSIIDLFSLSGLLALNNAIAVERYTNNISPGFFSQMLLPFVYLSALLGGYLYPLVLHRKDKLLTFLAFLPSCLILLILNTKAVLISSAILWISAYIVSYYMCNGYYTYINKFSLIKYGIAFSCFLTVLFISMMLRIGRLDTDTFFVVKHKFASYAIGHMGAFDSWFSANTINAPLHFGTMTFLSISNLLGLESKVQGIFTDYFYAGDISTNVYTALRPLVMDFGIFGSIIIYCCLGIITKILQNKFLKKSIIAIPISHTILICIYSYMLYGFIASLLSYTSYIIVWTLLFVCIYISNLKIINRRCRSNEI